MRGRGRMSVVVLYGRRQALLWFMVPTLVDVVRDRVGWMLSGPREGVMRRVGRMVRVRQWGVVRATGGGRREL